MEFEVIRMPQTEEQLEQTFQQNGPFLSAMYTENDERIHGPENFIMDHWVMLWASGAGFLLAAKEQGNIIGLGMCVKFRDMWYGKQRLEINRYSVANEVEDEKAVVQAMTDYLLNNRTLLMFDELYLLHRTVDGGEYKELVWRANQT